jgi:NADPH:quinone reductase-like Zn-dependent oxidoreductase
MAVQLAKFLGVGRVVAAGRSEEVLNTLHQLGADETIRLNQPGQHLIEAFRHAAGERRADGRRAAHFIPTTTWPSLSWCGV